MTAIALDISGDKEMRRALAKLSKAQTKAVAADTKPQVRRSSEIQRVAGGQKPTVAGPTPTAAARAAH